MDRLRNNRRNCGATGVRYRGETMTLDKDNINHPSHYAEGRKYEPIDVIEDWKLGFCLGNTVKYISRAGRKGDALEDLKKAAFYLNREIEREGMK